MYSCNPERDLGMERGETVSRGYCNELQHAPFNTPLWVLRFTLNTISISHSSSTIPETLLCPFVKRRIIWMPAMSRTKTSHLVEGCQMVATRHTVKRLLRLWRDTPTRTRAGEVGDQFHHSDDQGMRKGEGHAQSETSWSADHEPKEGGYSKKHITQKYNNTKK